MTATEELRRMLDKRGVEWRKTPHYSSESQDNETIFEGSGIEWYANDHMNGRIGLRALRYEVTPEQAIEATLGRGECEVEYVSEWMGWHCKACDVLWQGLRDQRSHFCPNCGRKVRA